MENKWISVKFKLPAEGVECLVTDGYDSYTCAELLAGEWCCCTDMLSARNYDGNCGIEIDVDVKYWAKIPKLVES